MLANLQLETIVTKLLAAAEEAAAGLKKEEDWKAFWGVHHDLARVLHGLGLFGAQEKPIEPSIVRDQISQEVEAMVQLRLKQQRRDAELLQMHRDGG